MAKVVPISGAFQSMHALLARIAEDENAIGFVGCVLLADGQMRPISFNCQRKDMAFASVILQTECVADAAVSVGENWAGNT